MVPSTSRSRRGLEWVDGGLDRGRAHRKWVVGIASGVQDLQQDLAVRVVYARR